MNPNNMFSLRPEHSGRIWAIIFLVYTRENNVGFYLLFFCAREYVLIKTLFIELGPI